MTWSFRKRIKVIPGVHLNFSKRGISTSIGVRGASITFREDGTYLNTGIPGTGFYNRERLSDKRSQSTTLNSDQLPYIPTADDKGNIISVDVDHVTSQDLLGIKSAIITANKQRNELIKDIRKVKFTLALSKSILYSSYIFIFGLVIKRVSIKINNNIKLQRKAIEELTFQRENSYVNLDIDFDPEIKKSYQNVVNSFSELASSACIWDVIRADQQDRVATRSAASVIVNKKVVHFQIKQLEDIRSEYSSLFLQNANGADMYIYPNFIVMKSRNGEFGLIDFKDLNFHAGSTRFVETGIIPKDTKTIGTTWAKVNKNGSPDKRFKGNYQIPIVSYGEILLTTNSGMNEAYEFSNNEACIKFATNFSAYLAMIACLPALKVNQNI